MISDPKISLLKFRFCVVAYVHSNIAAFILGIGIGINTSIGNNAERRMLPESKVVYHRGTAYIGKLWWPLFRLSRRF